MTSPIISRERRDTVVQLRLKGETYAAIGRDARVNLDRRTVKKIFEEWEQEQSSPDRAHTRQELKRELMSEHVTELVAFARGLARTLGVPDAGDQRSGEEVFQAFVGSHVRGTDTAVYDVSERDVRRLLLQRNERLCRDLRSHIESTEWWRLVGDYLRARDRLVDGQIIMEERVETLLTDGLRECGGIGVEFAERRGLIRRVTRGFSVAFISACVRAVDCEPLPASIEQLDSLSREYVRTCARCSFHHSRVEVQFALSDLPITVEDADARLHAAMCGSVESVARELADGEAGRHLLRLVSGSLLEMLKCHDRLMAEFHSPRLQSVILESRCDHCPV